MEPSIEQHLSSARTTGSFSPRPFVLATAVLAVMAARLLPHPPNFTPIGACALFGGACFADRRLAFVVPTAAMVLSDLVLGFTMLSPVVYACLFMQVVIGSRLRPERRAASIVGGVLLSAGVFFLVTNGACWLAFYPRTFAGVVECYVSAIPFLGRSLAGDATYSLLLFGSLAIAESRFPSLKEGVIPVSA